MWERAVAAHGTVTAQAGWTGKPSEAPPGMLIAGTPAPRITNAEAIQLIRAYLAAADSASVKFALWYAYAAIAYGWDPPTDTALDATASRADSSYVPDVCVALWMELHRITQLLDGTGEDARLDLDSVADFADASWLEQLKAQLDSDGVDATFKIPTPFCRDAKTGKQRIPYPSCDTKDPITGKPWRKCDKPGDCELVTVDDPITAAVKSLMPLALVVGAIWLLTRDTKPRRARRYRN